MKQKVFLSVWKNSLDPLMYKKPQYYFDREESSTSDYSINLGEIEIEFDLPPMPSDEELTTRQINYLMKGREETVKEFATKLQNIDDQISELLALPCLESE